MACLFERCARKVLPIIDVSSNDLGSPSISGLGSRVSDFLCVDARAMGAEASSMLAAQASALLHSPPAPVLCSPHTVLAHSLKLSRSLSHRHARSSSPNTTALHHIILETKLLHCKPPHAHSYHTHTKKIFQNKTTTSKKKKNISKARLCGCEYQRSGESA